MGIRLSKLRAVHQKGGLLLSVNYSSVNKWWREANSQAKSVTFPFYREGKVRKAWSPGHHSLPHSPVTFSAFGGGLLHGPGKAGRSAGPPGAEAGVGPTPNCLEPSRSEELAHWRKTGTSGGETSGTAPRADPQGALRRRPEVGQQCGHQKDPPQWTLENGVCENFRGKKTKHLRGLAQCLAHNGFVIHSWETIEMGRVGGAQRRVCPRCEMVYRGRS